MVDHSNKLRHGINMRNFIDQISSEHHLIDELVTNAVEAAESRVEIVHYGDHIIIRNDGLPLSQEQIQTKLLTAYETGDEKSRETNRGLGFISLYRHTSRAEVYTGDLILKIKDWDDIKLESGTYVNGFEIRAYLTTESKQLYSPEKVKEHLSQWIYWDKISLYFGSSSETLLPVGIKRQEALNLRSHPKYSYANLRYSLTDLGYSSNLVFLYKLTNVDVYRKLPVELDLTTFIPNSRIGMITLIISHGAYLDSTRRSLTDWGKQQVKTLLGLINADHRADSLRRSTFRIKQQAIELLTSRLTQLTSWYQLSPSWVQTYLKKLTRKFSNHYLIIRELSYWDQLFHLLVYADPPHKLSPLLAEVYHNFPEFLDQQDKEITPTEFHQWLGDIGISSSIFFTNTIIGFLLYGGDIEQEARVSHILQNSSRAICFDKNLFQSAVIQQVDLVVIIHEEAGYFVDLTDHVTSLPELERQYGIVDPTSASIALFTLSGQTRQIGNAESQLTTGILAGQVPYLNYASTDPDYQPLDSARLIQLYGIWKESVSFLLSVYDPPVNTSDIVPVVVFPRSTSKLACVVHHYIGVSINLLKQLQPGTEEIILLYAAIHEVAHLVHRTHSTKFYQAVVGIYTAIIAHDDLRHYLAG